jgi:exopolyphosphatase/guanosine-5'-triphosphate,3'-diphosphate pyrophosphatase
MLIEKNRYAIIDIGTNTCLLLIAEFQNDRLITISERQEIPRLGKGVDSQKNISRDAFERVLSVLKKYTEISESFETDAIFAIGTSFLRDSANSNEFIDYVNEATGIEIKILSGEDESILSYKGTVFDFENMEEYAVIDIGGGSTEISYLEERYHYKVSMDVGSLRIKERFFSEKPSENEINSAKSFVNTNLKSLDVDGLCKKSLIGVAGTLTTLSAIKLCLENFDAQKVHKTVLVYEEIENIFNRLIKMSYEEILKIGDYMKGRGDIITSGILILLQIMTFLKSNEIYVSTKGLRYGVYLDLVKGHYEF